jgi:hypothetical protein
MPPSLRSALTEIVRRAAWAPLAVLVVHAAAAWLGWRREADNLVHFLGGAAAAYFTLRCLEILGPLLGAMRRGTRLAVAFFGACTAAVFCELVEFASDSWLGTEVQQSLRETMLDLVAGVAGAAVTLVAIVVGRRPR